MENQVHSIHLPDSFPFLKGALERAVWCCFANRLFSSLLLWDGFPVALQEALSQGQGGVARESAPDREKESCFVELFVGRVVDKTVRFLG